MKVCKQSKAIMDIFFSGYQGINEYILNIYHYFEYVRVLSIYYDW